MKGKRVVLVAALTLLMAIGAFVLAGCSCSSQASSSSSSASSSASSSSSSAAQVQVPNLVHLEDKDAQKLLEEAGLKLGDITYVNDDTVAKGLIVSQKPEALAMVESGSKVSISVSKGKAQPAEVSVPNLIGMNQTDAESAVAAAKLVAVQDDPVVTNDVAPGLVCKQSIKPGTTVVEGSQISFATAIADNTVSVPDVKGLPNDAAQQTLQEAGLGVDTSNAYSDKVDEGVVMGQSVAAGTKVNKGTVVTIKLSLGPKPAKQVKVPNIYTFTKDDAIEALQSAGLDYRYTGEEDGTVVEVNPDVGTTVDEGTVVAFQLQAKKSTVEVPDIVGMKGNDALVTCQNLGLGLKYDESMGNEPLISQNPDAGPLVDPGFVVEGTEPDPEPQPTTVQVPDLVGMTGDDARACCEDLGLKFKYDKKRGGDTVSGQKPDAGTEVDAGTTIEAYFPDKPKDDEVQVPDVTGMTGDDAADAMEDAGLKLKYNQDHPEAVLSDTDPTAGTSVKEGSTVKAIYE